MYNFKIFNGVCPKYKVNVNGRVELKDASTQEGEEYAKLGVECNYKEKYECKRNECPFWINI